MKWFRGSREWTLAALVVLFAGGLVIAYFLTQSGWQPGVGKNYGELVQPVRPVGDAALVNAEGKQAPAGIFKGKWTLVYFGPAECLKPCIDALYKMRQLVVAQGRDAHRLRRVFVVTDPKARDALRYTIKDYEGTEIYFGTSDAVRKLATQFVLTVGSPLDNLHRLYVVDPLGNLMMSYPSDADLAKMNKDIKLLLRASHIG